MTLDGGKLFNVLSNITSKQIDAARQDKTILAEIVEIENADSGKYRVEYQGNTFFAASTNLDVVYKKGEQVYVLVPQGDFSGQKLILGYASYKSTTEEDSLQNFYLDVGSNWVGEEGFYTIAYDDNNELSLCAASTTDNPISPANRECIGFDYNNYILNDNGTIRLTSEFLAGMQEINTLGEFNEYIKISGEFKTNFLSQHTKGNYGLEVHLITKAEETDDAQNLVELENRKYVESVLTLGFPVFSGSPYNYTEYTKQTAYFRIPKGSVQGLLQIVLVQKDFETDCILATGEKVLNENNILVRNIEISFAQKINLTDTLWYAYISTPRGTRLNANNHMVKLTPHLLYKGHDIFNPENCEVQWFRQKADITIADVTEEDKDEHNKTWFDYGGNGWYPINKFIADKGLTTTETIQNGTEQEEINIVEEETSSPQSAYYSIEDGALIIHQAAVPFQWQYKAVIIYRDNSEKDYSTQEFPIEPITVINTDSEYDLTLEKYIDGLLSTFLRIRNYNKDAYGDQMAPDGRPYREWFGTYWLERIDGSYERVGTEKLLGPLNISRYMSAPIARFVVQCYDPYIIDPQNTAALINDVNSPYYNQPSLLSTVPEVATLTFECINITDSELDISWIGQDLFHYDVNGSLKTYIADRDNVIKPVLKWSSHSVSSYTLTVYGPGDQVLTRRDYGDNDNYFETLGLENTYDYSGSMMTGMFIDQDKCIHFKVRDQFDPSKTDNSFKLVISFSGRPEPFEKTVPITFIKDGDQGTMGAEWIAPLYPCGFNDMQSFTKRLDSQQTVPLVVAFNPTDSTVEWQQVDSASRLILRPFVAKNGVLLESMDKYEGYFYRCYWDVRTPSSINNALAQNASFLRLYRVETGETAEDVVSNRIFSFGDTLGTNTHATAFNSNDNFPHGLVAKTGYPALNEQSSTLPTNYENYGAVEVRFFDNRCPKKDGNNIAANNNNTIAYNGTGASLEDIQYRFVVKCQIDIFKGHYDKAQNILHTTGDNVQVASITSFYPVDIIFVKNTEINGTEINLPTKLTTAIKKIQVNWPRYVEYNGSGYDPVTTLDTNGLSFTVSDADPNQQTKYLAENLTPLIQEIENRIDANNNLIQIYKPSTHLNMTEGFCGAMRTIPGNCAALFDDAESFFVRNQVMYLNSFSNVDINGWDGQSIETDEQNGSIFAATLGAGFKEPTTNLFTGVLMGMDKSQRRDAIKGETTRSADYIRSHPYMTGIFGFQDGISSFGLMENGTGFFGRPDRGGRIIFDGYNATLYGGANGTMESPSLGDPMWNTMRLSFVDLTHSASDSFISVKGANGEVIEQGFDGAYFTDSKLSNRTNMNSLPRWYSKMWKNAYIKPNGKLPYWFPNSQNIKVSYNDLYTFGATINTTEPGADNYVNPESAEYLAKNDNRKINYYDKNQAIFESVSTAHLEKEQAALKYAKEQYDLDPKGTYKEDEPAPADPYYLDVFYYDSEHTQEIIVYKGVSKHLVYSNMLKLVSQAKVLSGFGAARTSTTPAIEIGQHIDGLMPGLLDWDDYESIFKELRIPGNRNFMVTYDGTLWAMNGVFMGAIIGSNIIGGRIQGAEIGIGTSNINTHLYTINDASVSGADYGQMLPPKEDDVWTSRALLESKGGGRNLGFYVSSAGEVIANNISIYGGKIDVGHLHILGNEQADSKERGHLIQIATSDFIGETHCYGGLTVSPSEVVGTNSHSNYGNFFQTHGTVALGISKNKHTTMIKKFWHSDSTSGYDGDNGDGLNGESFNQCCFFGLDTAANTEDKYKGHFWPLSFRLSQVNGTTRAYATTMNIFANGIVNYFRVGPWGTEGVRHFVKTGFQSENSCDEPTSTNSLGYIGNISNHIGIYSWDTSSIILTVGSSTNITITKNNITFTVGGKTYSLTDLANNQTGSGGSTTTETDSNEEGTGSSEPALASGSSTNYSSIGKKSWSTLGINPQEAADQLVVVGSDGTQYKWIKSGSYYYLWVYDPQDNQYHNTWKQAPLYWS